MQKATLAVTRKFKDVYVDLREENCTTSLGDNYYGMIICDDFTPLA